MKTAIPTEPHRSYWAFMGTEERIQGSRIYILILFYTYSSEPPAWSVGSAVPAHPHHDTKQALPHYSSAGGVGGLILPSPLLTTLSTPAANGFDLSSSGDSTTGCVCAQNGAQGFKHDRLYQ